MRYEAMEIASLRVFVEREIERYVYVHPEGSVGMPMPDSWVQQQLAEFRGALVEPKWATIHIRDTADQWEVDPPILRACC
jgi:hypothetical protein